MGFGLDWIGLDWMVKCPQNCESQNKIAYETGCLPDHSNQKEKRSLHGRIFCLAYLLHGVRSIHQCTLQDTHFCSQNSRDGEKQNTV